MIEKILKIYERVITEEFVSRVHECIGIKERSGIFQSSIVYWLMLFQRLRQATLVETLDELRLGASNSLLERASGSIRARAGRTSGNTGGISQARERLPVAMVKATTDALNEEILKGVGDLDETSKRIYIIDGSTIRTQHTLSNLKKFPQFQNQYGAAHYPIVRIGIAIHAASGIALRPAYGPFNGKDAVSELTLASDLMRRLPANSIMIGDRFYGCVRFALEAKEHGHEVICRVKEGHCKKYISTTPSGECEVIWESKKKETIKGRFIWETIRVPGEKPYRLILFTTTNLASKELLKLYALRWNVEIDLRDIKSTLKMESLECRTPEMFEKELIVGIAAYNLIRHAMVQMGNAHKISYRQFSFSRFVSRIRAIEGCFLSQRMSDHAKINALTRALTDYKSLVLPKRKKPRPNEPRKVWPKGNLKIMRGSRASERQKISNNKNFQLN